MLPKQLIDGGFLRDAGIEIREMNSGCICCSLVGDFGKSLEEVLTKYISTQTIPPSSAAISTNLSIHPFHKLLDPLKSLMADDMFHLACVLLRQMGIHPADLDLQRSVGTWIEGTACSVRLWIMEEGRNGNVRVGGELSGNHFDLKGKAGGSPFH